MANINISDLKLTDLDLLSELTNEEVIATYGGFLGITINLNKIFGVAINTIKDVRDFGHEVWSLGNIVHDIIS